MQLKINTSVLTLVLVLYYAHQCEIAACFKSEVEITPSPIEEATTKKSGFFSGLKNLFSGSSSSTTTTIAPLPMSNTPRSVQHDLPAAKPPPLVIPRAPLMPLGPRPDTPSSSPHSGNPQQPPAWPAGQPLTSGGHTLPSNINPPVFPQHNANNQPSGPRYSSAASWSNPTHGSYHPPKPLPSGVDLSYGGSQSMGGNLPHDKQTGLVPLTLSTTTTTTTSTIRPRQPQPTNSNIDFKGNFDRNSNNRDEFPALPVPRRPSPGTVGEREQFPALPLPKSPSPTPSSSFNPSSPSAWNTPLPQLSLRNGATTPVAPTRAASPIVVTSTPAGSRVAFVPHVPSVGTSTTIRPGFQNSGNSLATDDEIRALTENLYSKEVNTQLNLITVRPQGKTRSIDSTDEAPQPLLAVDDKALEPLTIVKMRMLFNNYEEDTLVNEHVTPNERREENEFLDAILSTSVMRQAMLFLQNKDIVTADPKSHRDLVKELWFTQYSRGKGKIGSSGFEHVFVHEVKNGTLIGLHNWVYFYEEEKAGRLDYKGYINQLDLGSKAKILKARFSHNGVNKPVNTLFIGTSPELELALYTICFHLRPDRTCPVSLGNSRFGIVTYSWRYRGKNLIGTAYPEI